MSANSVATSPAAAIAARAMRHLTAPIDNMTILLGTPQAAHLRGLPKPYEQFCGPQRDMEGGQQSPKDFKRVKLHANEFPGE